MECFPQIIYVAPMKALAAEMVQKFSRQLQCLGISVRELTGDMQLTKREIETTQVLTVLSVARILPSVCTELNTDDSDHTRKMGCGHS